MSLPELFAYLAREHEDIAGVVGRARATAEAALQYGDPHMVSSMLTEFEELRAFLSKDLTSHIAQEEQALFPAFLRLTRERRLIEEPHGSA
ncbi:MAG: hemerythrin domain-containing protein [Dehalococcoidia bacterium]|nr:hemerythrin domain-containing protein [Dehalococcoidia bacterium]